MTYVETWNSLHDAVIAPHAYCILEKLLHQMRLLRTNLCELPYERPHDYEFRITFNISALTRAPDNFFICISSGEVANLYFTMYMTYKQIMNPKQESSRTNMELIEAIDDLVKVIDLSQYVPDGEPLDVNQLPQIFLTRERFEKRYGLDWRTENIVRP